MNRIVDDIQELLRLFSGTEISAMKERTHSHILEMHTEIFKGKMLLYDVQFTLNWAKI